MINIKRYVGETSISSKGEKMTLIEYNCNTNITVQFEDGTIVKKKSYQNFLNGTIRNPHYNKTTHIGETVTNNQNCEMTVIEYRGINDIDIQFSDNTIVKRKTYHAFIKGSIKNPNYKRVRSIKKDRIGETSINKKGLKMTIIAYRGIKDIDVQFEDDTISYHKQYDAFKKGKIKKPYIKGDIEK